MTSIKTDIRILKVAMTALSSMFPLSGNQISLIEKDFKPVNQSEAFDILAYLIKASSEKINFKILNLNVWKKVDSDSRKDVEKFKKDVLAAIKELSLKGKENITVLKKSDLVVPYCPRFLSCCAGLSSYALSYQLQRMGIDLWPKQSANLTPSEKKEILEYVESERAELQEEVKLYNAVRNRLTEQIERLRNELAEWIRLKNMVHLELDALINTQTFINKDMLKNECLWERALKDATKAADDLSVKNRQRLESLKKLDDTLDFVKNVLESPFEKYIIDGKELSAKLNYETRIYAEREQIDLFEGGLLNLGSLFSVIVKSFHAAAKGKVPVYERLSELFRLKPPPYEPTLLGKLESMKQKLQKEIAEHLQQQEKGLNKQEVHEWFHGSFTQIPSLEFTYDNMPTKIRWRDPFADLYKIECLLASSKPSDSMKADNSSSSVLSQMQLNPSDSWKFKYLARRNNSSSNFGLTNSSINICKTFGSNSYKQKFTGIRSSSTHSIFSQESPLSTARMESTKLWRSRLLRRRSKSSSNLASTRLSISGTNDSPGSTVEGKERLCSTPKAEDNFFEGDKSISPISILSVSVCDKTPLEYNRNSLVTNESLTLNNASFNWMPSSYASTSSNDTRNTFDSVALSLPDVSMDSRKSLSLTHEESSGHPG